MRALTILGLALALIPANALVTLTSKDAGILGRICAPQGNATVDLCNPYDTASFVRCTGGKGYVIKCKPGNRYDYGTRTCLPAKKAKTCPRFNCPVSDPAVGNATLGTAPLSPAYGVFGQPGNATLSFSKAGHYSVYCPVYGHCAGGMLIDVTVYPKTKHAPITYNYPAKKAEYEEVLQNTDMYPKTLPPVTLHVGDKLFIDWDEPIHLVAVYDMTGSKRVPIVPYPPQPKYKCPNFNVTATGGFAKVPGEIRLVGEGVGDMTKVDFPPVAAPLYTWGPATKPDTFFFVCSLANHCRLGMVFKTTVLAAPAGYVPKTVTVQWVVTYENFPDITIYVGDSVKFVWGGPEPVHMLSILPTMEEYKY